MASLDKVADLFRREDIRRGWRWLKNLFMEPAPGTEFTVLVADLRNDGDGAQTRHVQRALEGQTGIRVRLVGEVLKLPSQGDIVKLQAKTEATGRAWLKEHNADILIWGEVVRADASLDLRFLSRHGGNKGGQFALGDELRLPVEFLDQLGEILHLTALTVIRPLTEVQGLRRARYLEPVLGKVKRLLDDPPSFLTPPNLGAIWGTYGNALATLGEREESSARLEEAVRAYEAVLKIFTRVDFSVDWARTQNNLGNTLAQLGEREEGTARLDEAVASYRQAFQVFTRAKFPVDWAMTQNNLGNALRTLGTGKEGTARLEEAVAAFRQALEVRTQKDFPIQWAGTQNNLGNALRNLGAGTEGAALLEEAVTAYKAALEVYRTTGHAYYVTLIEKNLAKAQVLIAERREAGGKPPDS